jgi:hypothetical protein
MRPGYLQKDPSITRIAAGAFGFPIRRVRVRKICIEKRLFVSRVTPERRLS